MHQAIGYVRVSTQGQADEGVSLDAQESKIRAWCDLHGHELLCIYRDEGISGASMKGREGLDAALRATGKNMALVCYSISRLARSTKDLLHIADEIKAKRASLVSITEQIDTASAMGEFFFTVIGAIATLERKVTGERTRMALAHKKAVGEVYSPVPFGFDEVNGRLVVAPLESSLVAEIVRRRNMGESFGRIARELNIHGIGGKRGGRWHASTVKYLIERQGA